MGVPGTNYAYDTHSHALCTWLQVTGARVCPLIEPIELAKTIDSIKYTTIQITRAYEIQLAVI